MSVERLMAANYTVHIILCDKVDDIIERYLHR